MHGIHGRAASRRPNSRSTYRDRPVPAAASWVVYGLAVLLLAGVSPASRSATGTGPALGPNVSPKSTSLSTSTNWAGYAISTANGAVTDVQGNWTEPAFKGTCAGFYNRSYADFWVGIDGWGSNTVEQIGTEISCQTTFWLGGVGYSAWYEFYPASPVTISMAIHPGDRMHGEVKHTAAAGGTFIVSLKDISTNKSFSKSTNSVSANRSSAEWIAEAPSSGSGSIYPLVDFGVINFTSAFASISGHVHHPVGSYANFRVTMWTVAYTAKKAVSSALAGGGTRFSVAWKTYGP